MSENLEKTVLDICQACGNDRGRLMDIVRGVQEKFGQVSGQAIDLIASTVGAHRVEVESVVTFYAFLSERPTGKFTIRVSNCVPCMMGGAGKVAKSFEDALGISMGQTTSDGRIGLEWTSCMGMCDQGPAALVDGQVLTYLGPDRARESSRSSRPTTSPPARASSTSSATATTPTTWSARLVHNNIRKQGEVVFAPFDDGQGAAQGPGDDARGGDPRGQDGPAARSRRRGFPDRHEVGVHPRGRGRREVRHLQRRRGRARHVQGPRDPHRAGRPAVRGHDDRRLRHRRRARASCICAASTPTCRRILEDVLAKRREAGLLGKNVGGKEGFDFDIRIQMGAGAYICGEETALISSCEGMRGDPKNRPPFPAQKGYLGMPDQRQQRRDLLLRRRGSSRRAPAGSPRSARHGSPGTKLLSISGDCTKPGVYEVPFGIKLSEVLEMVGAADAVAVQVGGPSGQMVGPKDFERTICYDDLATGGSMIVFDTGSATC